MRDACGSRWPILGRLSTISTFAKKITKPSVVAQFGLPPNRIDVLTNVSGLEFDAAWENRVATVLEGIPVYVIGLTDLVKNKSATGRDKDRVDIKGLEGRS